MKVYIQNHGWSGGSVVIANSKEEAIAKFKEVDGYYDEKEEIEEFELTEFKGYGFFGDR
jgi:hypothetical protein